MVIEAALSQVVGDAVERAYFRGDYLAKRRALMIDWDRFCTKPPADNVVAMPRIPAAAG